jgi:hypothetical protein
MHTQTETDRTQLTSYETEQVQEIAVWKSQPPNPVSELWQRITLPVARVVKRLIPDPLVRAAIAQSYETSARLAGQKDIERRAGVDNLADLRNRPLEECDRMAKQVGANAMVLATVEGAATGAGGVLTTLIDVPLLFVLTLRTILKIGHCYGYALDDRKDRQFVLGVLVTAVSGTPETRRQRIDRLDQVEDLLIEETQEEVLTEELTSFLFQVEIFEEVPGVGAISGGLLNLAFLRRVDQTARRAFQERWLLDNGKVDAIAPAEVHPRYLAPGWSGGLGRLAYSGCYSLGFGAALPVFVTAELIRPMGTALTRGIRESAAQARRGIAWSLPRGWGAAAPAHAEGEAVSSLAPA